MARLNILKQNVTMLPATPVAQVNEAQWGAGRGGRPWRRIRDRILLRDQYTCRACGLVTKDLEVDHIINVAEGGSDDDSNLQALCVPCHQEKTAAEAARGRR
ncbi:MULTISPECIES: HNH endonuclease [Pseudomonas]|uniref:HNH endonuclease n=1 Tax=Pseudomonas putida (strain ATCC 700007 / DSM 6899 / JCM 31910 / BCRC 17059 / LMG 24140 / F1) TaxID=351746 RepID=A5W7Y2_PSEP1|nr:MULTISPECIES: HNH endonuclease signature motif containing protein [Pseudomonas]MCX2816489.1 HNH endonuclease signature motif containing protein [Pseudomonas sp. DCB_E]MCX9143102.1 HNH endonuclease [Pseudomonas sp. DCB_Q]MDD2001515.1 HNH endonuclease [Pseudomonas putida]